MPDRVSIPARRAGSGTGSSTRPCWLVTQTRWVTLPGSIATTSADDPSGACNSPISHPQQQGPSRLGGSLNQATPELSAVLQRDQRLKVPLGQPAEADHL